MTKRRTYTNKQREEALRIYETEGTTAASKQLGIPKNTIQGWARKRGIRTVRTAKTQAATEAVRSDSAKLRALIEARSYELADLASQEMIRRLTKDPGTIEVKDLAPMFGVSVDKGLAISRADSDNGATNAKGLLVALAEQIGVGSE